MKHYITLASALIKYTISNITHFKLNYNKKKNKQQTTILNTQKHFEIMIIYRKVIVASHLSKKGPLYFFICSISTELRSPGRLFRVRAELA